jgi:hypothetical protein
MYREWEEIEFPKKVLHMNLEIRLRGRPRNRRSEGGWKTSWWKRVEGKGI